jgi:small subunit ribosomal protein S2
VAAILDSNSDPDGIAYPIPGNDDASRAIALYCELVARAVIDGLSEGQVASGADIGEAENVIQDLTPRASAEEVEASPLG